MPKFLKPHPGKEWDIQISHITLKEIIIKNDFSMLTWTVKGALGKRL